MIKKYAVVAVLILVAMFTPEFRNVVTGANEINKVIFIRTIGIDKLPKKDMVSVTITSKNSSSGSGKDESATDIITTEGKTIFEAIRNMQKFASKNPYWGHVDYILVGEDVGKEGLVKYLDFFIREHQINLHSKVAIIKGGKAKDAINTINTKDVFISDRINILFKGAKLTSFSGEAFLDDISVVIERGQQELYLPYFRLKDEEETEDKSKSDTKVNEKESEEKSLLLDGYAIFKGEKLLTYIEENLSKGLNLLSNKFKSGIIVVRDNIGKQVSLEVVETSIKYKSEITMENKPKINIKVKVASNIGEYEGQDNIFTKEKLQKLEGQQEYYIKNLINKIINFTKENNVDILGISNKLYHKNPKKWSEIEGQWSTIFKETNYDVTVDSTIIRTYVMKEPTRVKGGG